LDYLRRPIDLRQLDVALGRARERLPQREVPEAPLILAVDDHEPTLRRLAQVLKKEGFRVLSAADGEQALGLFREHRVDVVLADLRMPHVDGLQLLRETKGRGADVEVIVMTGYGDEDSVVHALRDGAINFLRKPIDIEQMLLAIQKALDYEATRRSLAHRNRDVELMQELVVRLTRKLELVVETPRELSPQAVGFLQQLIDSLPLGIVVASVKREVMYANRQVLVCLGQSPQTLTVETLRLLGLPTVGEEQFEQAFERASQSGPGMVETLVLSEWSFLVMTPLTLLRADGSRRYVALAIRGERTNPDTASP
jgi:FixJ family two-component response regulator